ncbi:hypothetical protein [Floridanema evergladense]|uniref:Uncharacterized protein n=1 Tax=Floridaenema evergladense BLCC-F167 TaxID=3153639 RepID=A0ABV4WT17_9CYAN
MYTEEQIKQLFSDKILKYLKKKNAGGISNEKGNTYENIFALYQIACLSKQVIEDGRGINFYSQIKAFIDDLIIDFTDTNLLQHYQLKNSQNIVWGKGDKSISDDFKNQYILNQSISKISQLYLVVSDEKLKTKLKRNLPSEIKLYSQVIYFSYQPNFIKFVKKNSDFREAIVYLSAFENPDPDKMESVATVLLGAWVSSNKNCVSLIDILKKAQGCTPSYIRSFALEYQLDPELENILNQVPNFSYNLTKGFLHWSYGDGLDEGTLPYSIESDQFQRFKDLIKRNRPTTFDQLEAYLI